MSAEWMADGKCREYAPETFFPRDGMGVIVAQRICATCPVASECLVYALDNHIDHGVWGGKSERERRRLLRERRRLRLFNRDLHQDPRLFECVVNVSDGRRLDVLDELGLAAGPALRDRHSDAVHNRSVFTLIDHRIELRRYVRSFIVSSMKLLDLRDHEGVHPCFGVLDVVPFVALDSRKADEAAALRNETASWMADTFNVPVFLYGRLRDGTKRSLPEVRRHAFRSLMPDMGPMKPDPDRGASAIGARPVLVAWNLWVRGIDLAEGRIIAKALRRPEVRALAFQLPDMVQISFNLIDPMNVRPSAVYDKVVALLDGGVIDHAELVGLVPDAVLRAEDPKRWEQLGLSEGATIESRLA